MRILQANSVVWPHMIGGAETVVMLLARELTARGLSVDLLATTGRAGRNRPSERRIEGVAGSVYEAPDAGRFGVLDAVGDTRLPLVVRLAYHAGSAHSGRWENFARHVLRQTRPDLLHTHNLVGMTPSLWRAAHAENVPIVHTLHDHHLLCARTTLLRSRLTVCTQPPLPCRLLMRAKLAPSHLIAAVTAPTRFILDRHFAEGAFAGTRAVVIPHAPEPVPGSLPRRTGAPAGGLFIGQLQVHKGLRELLGALKLLHAGSATACVAFEIAGAGPLAAEVATACAALGDRCRFLGRVEDEAREAAYARAGFVVVPSLWPETAGLVILEAAARGLPAIAARRGGIPELVADGETGFLVEPEPAALATAIARYTSDPALARRHGEAAARRAGQYTRRRQVESYLKVYSEILGRAIP